MLGLSLQPYWTGHCLAKGVPLRRELFRAEGVLADCGHLQQFAGVSYYIWCHDIKLFLETSQLCTKHECWRFTGPSL